MIAALKIEDARDPIGCWTENQAIMHHYAVTLVLPTLKDDGIWFAPGPSPLSTEQVIEVYKAIIRHPAYRGQKLDNPDLHGDRVMYDGANGVISIKTNLEG